VPDPESLELAVAPPGEALPGTNVNVSRILGNESEVLVDIDPTNTNRAVVVGHAPSFSTMNTFFTADGGATWSLVPLGNAQDGLTSTFRFDPTLAFDDNGVVYVGYGAKIGPPTASQGVIVVCRSTDGGQTYPLCTRIDANNDIDTTGDGNTNFPGNDKWHLATGPAPGNLTQQNVYIAWTRNVEEPPGSGAIDQQIVVSRSTDGAASFSPSRIINDASVPAAATSLPTRRLDRTASSMWRGSMVVRVRFSSMPPRMAASPSGPTSPRRPPGFLMLLSRLNLTAA
jgi:hypothetical protein